MERLGLPSRVWFGQSYDQVHKLYEYILKVEEAKKKSCESVIHMTADVKKITHLQVPSMQQPNTT